MKAVTVIALSACLTFGGCSKLDPNAAPEYRNGLAVNCRAYVQVVIDGYRAKTYTAEQSMNALERNCGMNGYSWKN